MASFLLPGLLAAAQVPRGAALGRLVDAPDGQSRMEQLAIEPGLAPSLLSVPLEGSIRIEDWPVAPGARRTVVVTRHDIYAPDAKIVAIQGGKEVEVPRSKLVFLWGTAEGDGATSVLVTVDPDTATVTGSSTTPEGSFDLFGPNAQRSSHLLAKDGALRSSEEEGPGFQCAHGDLPKDPTREALRKARLGAVYVPQVLASLHTAVIAVDTDNEFMLTKFADNTTNATNYIAQVFAGITAIYERDVFVRLLQGYTVLRLSTTPDPYVQVGGGNASPEKLYEVSAYWNTNYPGIKRALVMMLSGKQASGGWSGIAWISGLCEPYYGVGFNQVFRTGTTAGVGDFQLIGHEMGHNFGSPHTHCTDTSAAAGMQPIDFCRSGECSWTPDPGASCPANFNINPINGAPVNAVRGTLMSYCHLLGGCGVTNVFHPQSISLAVGPDVDAAVGQCIFPAGNPAPTVTSIAPVGGPIAGGTAVTITGTNFRSPATVAFADLGSGKPATGVVVVNPTTITATTPAHTVCVKDVVVSNPDHQTGILKTAFLYRGVPAIASISPNWGDPIGGTPVTITGSNFGAPATVTFGGVAATSIVVVSPTTMTAVAPAHALGLVNVTISNCGGDAGTLSGGYRYGPPPIGLSGITPNGGTTAGGTPVTITGTNFVAPATVTLGGTAATAVNVASASTITATTPAHAAGAVNVVVQSNAQSATLTNGYFYFTPAPPASFHTLSPCRLVDTRNANGARGGPALVASTRRNFTLTDVCGIPTTAKAISVNITVTGATAPGFISLFPGDGLVPATSNINFSASQTRANNAVVLLATNATGVVAVLNGAAGATHFILDVNGYFQ